MKIKGKTKEQLTKKLNELTTAGRILENKACHIKSYLKTHTVKK